MNKTIIAINPLVYFPSLFEGIYTQVCPFSSDPIDPWDLNNKNKCIYYNQDLC
jgi:hypothetical protein